MANDKSLKIGSIFDPSGIKKVETALKALKREGIEVAKAFKNINLGTGHGNATFAKSIVQASESTRKFKGVSEDASRSLKNIWGKQVEEEQKKLAHYTTRVETLSKAYQKQQKVLQQFKEQGGSPYAIKAAEARSARFGGALIGAQTSKESYAASIKELTSDPAAMSGIMKALGLIGGVGGAIAGIAALGSTYQNNKNVSVGNLAAVGGVTGALLSMSSSNPGLMGAVMAQKTVLPGQEVTPGRSYAEAYEDRDRARRGLPPRDWSRVHGTSTQSIIDNAGGKGATIVSDIAHPGNWTDDLFRGRLSKVETEKKMEALQNVVTAMPGEQRIMDNLLSTAGIRTMAGRRLGGRGSSLQMAAIGAGVGDDIGDSLGFSMGMAERFGSQALGAQGFSAQAIRAQQQGLNKDFVGSFLGTAAGGGANGEEVLKRIFSEGVTKGMSSLGVQFYEKIGGAVANASTSKGGPQGTEGLSAIAASFMSGQGGKTSSEAFRDISRREQGAATFEQLSNIPAVKGLRFMLANQIVKNDDIDAKMALAGADLNDLIGGNSPLFKDFGLDKKSGTQMTSGIVGGLLSKWTLGKDDSASGRLRGLLKKDGGLEGFMKDPEALGMLSSVATTRTGVGARDSWLGFFERLTGTEGLDKSGKRPGNVGDGVAESQKMALASMQMTTIAQESRKTLDYISAGVKKFVDDLAAAAKGIDIESGNRSLDRVKPVESKPKTAPRVSAPLPLVAPRKH